MSKGLAWAIKLISWFAIYFIFSMSFDGDMPFWAYFIVVLLCVAVQEIVEYFIKDDQNKNNKIANEKKSEEKGSGDNIEK